MRSSHDTITQGTAELRAARRETRGLYWPVAIFSFFVNALMLTGPLYMLNVYDRVLGSRSLETLIALSVLVTFLYGMMALLDYVRGRVMARVGARFQARLDARVFAAALTATTLGKAQKESATAMRDLESVQRLIISPALMSVFDMPFMPLFFFGIFLFHPGLGYLALGGAGFLVLLAIANQMSTNAALVAANATTHQAEVLGLQIRSESEMVHALGMRGAAFSRWRLARDRALDASIGASDASGGYTAVTRAVRLFLQSAMLGLGAYYVLRNYTTGPNS